VGIGLRDDDLPSGVGVKRDEYQGAADGPVSFTLFARQGESGATGTQCLGTQPVPAQPLLSLGVHSLPTRRTHLDTVEIKNFILQATIPMVTFVHRAVPAPNLPYLVTFGFRR
jgi:hypothetical protein